MRVETLEYGDNPKSEYPEDWNSFKVLTVWSQPGAKDSTINDKELRTERVRENDK